MLALPIIIIPSPFQCKLNYFSFCRNFEKLFIICVKNFNKIKNFHYQGLNPLSSKAASSAVQGRFSYVVLSGTSDPKIPRKNNN